MKIAGVSLCFAAALSAVFAMPAEVCAQSEMTMPGMENSAGALSSGTSIEPQSTSESSPVVYSSLGTWSLMFHANAFVEDLQQSGPRGADKFFSTNWLMPMLRRSFGPHAVTFRTMLSLEPMTITKRRYPELFQTGETAYGLPIVDGQHPHNFVSELSLRYDFTASARTQMFVYGGPVAEPALGPSAFPHRGSASENPIAPLGHHEEDSTHISISVVTLGVVHGPFQLEASTFHGRESNENRWTIGHGAPDSYSSRLTAAASKNLSGQFSIGRIHDREALEPGVDTIRTTASLHHNVAWASGHLSSSLIWGRNKDLTIPAPEIFNAYTLESTANVAHRNWLWTRIENLDRDRTLLAGETSAALSIPETPIGRVQAYSFGYERDLPPAAHTNAGLGVQFTTYGLPAVLEPIYGNRPRSLIVFIRLRPLGNMPDHMKMMH